MAALPATTPIMLSSERRLGDVSVIAPPEPASAFLQSQLRRLGAFAEHGDIARHAIRPDDKGTDIAGLPHPAASDPGLVVHGMVGEDDAGARRLGGIAEFPGRG